MDIVPYILVGIVMIAIVPTIYLTAFLLIIPFVCVAKVIEIYNSNKRLESKRKRFEKERKRFK